MPGFKYFQGISDAQKMTARQRPEPLPPFDLTPLATKSQRSQRWQRWLFRKVLPPVASLLRTVAPNLKIGRLVIVTRDEDVRQVLSNPQQFQVPFGLEMTELAGGTNSVLGLEGKEHERLRGAISEVLRTDEKEDLKRIRNWSRGYASALVDASGGTLDVVTDLITRTATETCCRYFGVSLNDPVAFGHWTIAVSNMLFADPRGDARSRALALNGAARIRAVLEDAVARVRENDRLHPNSKHRRDSLVDRFVGQGILSDPEIVATLMGLATGFIPTNTLAAGNMLEELLARPKLMDKASQAAKDGKVDDMRAVLFEAAVLNSPLSPGQWRHVTEDTVIAPGTRRKLRVRKGSIVLASTMSALRDPTGTSATAEGPEQKADLIFGFGEHSCLGRYVAMEQIVQVFMVLLSQTALAVAPGRHGWMKRLSVFPIRLDMNFASARAGQSMAIICAPLQPGAKQAAVEKEIGNLQNPASAAVAGTLDATGIIHFCSLNVVEKGPGNDGAFIIFEINADGSQAAAIDSISHHCFSWLSPLMRHCRADGTKPANSGQLAELLTTYALDLHCFPWGATGVHYNGTPEFSVADIDRQDRLARFARRALDHYLQEHIGRRGRAMEALVRVRRLAKQDCIYQLRKSWRGLRKASAPFEFSLARPSRNRLALATWQPPKSMWYPWRDFAGSRDGVLILTGLALTWLAVSTALYALFWEGPPQHGIAGLAQFLGRLVVVALAGSAVTVIGIVVVFAAVAGLLYVREIRDEVDELPPALDRINDIAAREDEPGYEQNHILAVVPLKPGAFRKLVFAFALWGIKQSVKYWFRPGFVVTMGTIHYAKWFRIPGTEQFLFLSNYDGSWESYLEDFITRAHWGQTAAWSNGVGFPRTRFLIFDGARDGDRFKRWVRRQQRVSLFWYSRFPELTTKQIRNHAIIEDGLASAVNDTDAKRWLACFGSAQREEHELETSETQSIVFSGFGRLHYASCFLLTLPDTDENRLAWIKALIGAGFRDSEMEIFGPHARLFTGQRIKKLHRSLQVAFGDYPVSHGASVLGLTAAGLKICGLPSGMSRGGRAEFPAAFNFGMAGRSRILGDWGNASSENWLWRDTGSPAAEAVLISYGQLSVRGDHGSQALHERMAAMHRDLLEHLGGKILHVVPTSPLTHQGKPTLDIEHFGFRDGISQPVIRGTQRTSEGNDTQDVVEAGEIILGYRNNQGAHAPPLWVPEESDYRNDLPTLDATVAQRFPLFGTKSGMASPRDFGRNGSFLAIRQLDQDVDGFNVATQQHAADIRSRYRDIEHVAGHRIDGEWVAAKMVGRWRDGTPLVGHMAHPERPTDDRFENGFAFGIDDARGFQCPMGAHIRRSNPRDSFEPGDATERLITSRHRLLRRGRSYCYSATKEDGEKKGLLFMALCSDLERQFEFVQQTWINSGSFHALVNERDPVASHSADPRHETCFTIPMSAGPIVLSDVASHVRLRAGGYFFLPSLSACKYLCSLGAGPKEREHDEWMLSQ